ncbi:MAG: FliH/SctL family protein [Oceanicaulis sp.]
MTDTFKRFAFDREFAADGTVLRDGDTIKRVLTEAEAHAMAEKAAGEARNSEEAQAAREAADALKQVSGKLHAMIARLDAESEALRHDAARLAVAAARAVAGAALDQYGAETVEQCVKEALSDLRAEPRIAVRVAPHLADPLAERLYQYAAAEGFDGAVVVRADDEAAAGDCVIEWRSGAIERTAAEIETRIQTAVETWLARPAEERDAPGEAGGGAAA